MKTQSSAFSEVNCSSHPQTLHFETTLGVTPKLSLRRQRSYRRVDLEKRKELFLITTQIPKAAHFHLVKKNELLFIILITCFKLPT